MDTQTLLSEIAAVVGADKVRTDITSASGVTLPEGWGNPPLALVTPGSVAEVVGVVKAAEAAGIALLPCGGGTQLQTGYPPRADKPYLLVNSDRMKRILDYQPDDLTVTCEPGVTLATLQETLTARRQMLALDVPLLERATLGGIVSANTTGFWRPAYGAPRDLIIGLRAVMTGGVEVKGGGKVVKNVAGYDVCKLFTGAWGTLGFLTELTFKVRARPEAERVLAWDAPDLATAARVGLVLHHARLAPTYILVTNELEGRPRLVVGLQGSEARLDWQAEELARRAGDAGLGSTAVPLADAQVTELRDRQARLSASTPLAARIACLLTEVVNVVRELETRLDGPMTAHCGTGIVSFAATNPDVSLVNTVKVALSTGANLVWTRLDEEFAGRDEIPVWGETREEFFLHRALKQTLDPNDTFSPGRFLGKL